MLASQRKLWYYWKIHIRPLVFLAEEKSWLLLGLGIEAEVKKKISRMTPKKDKNHLDVGVDATSPHSIIFSSCCSHGQTTLVLAVVALQGKLSKNVWFISTCWNEEKNWPWTGPCPESRHTDSWRRCTPWTCTSSSTRTRTSVRPRVWSCTTVGQFLVTRW